jgi:hypothetical protein
MIKINLGELGVALSVFIYVRIWFNGRLVEKR